MLYAQLSKHFREPRAIKSSHVIKYSSNPLSLNCQT